MEQNTDLAARLARLDARRQSTTRPAAAGSSVAPTARRRPHAARRSRIGVTIGSAMAMVGLTGAMALADQTASASETVTADVAVSQATGSTTNSSAVATTVTAAAAATPTTVAVTQSNGS